MRIHYEDDKRVIKEIEKKSDLINYALSQLYVIRQKIEEIENRIKNNQMEIKKEHLVYFDNAMYNLDID